MLTLREVAVFTHGEVRRGERIGVGVDGDGDAERIDVEAIRIDAVSTDSRRVPNDALFVALAGDRFDGHAFVDEVAARGARAVLIERGRQARGLPSVAVTDSRRALGDLAAGWRRRFSMPLVVVVGSNGKTTTKEMVASILVAAYGVEDCCATEGNLNNDIGMPLTLLRLRAHHRAAVVELGMNHPGETARLAEIAQPSIALVVNAQREHQEFMCSVAAVADEHALAIAALPGDGVAVFPASDVHATVWRQAAGRRGIVDFACVTASGEEPTPAAVTGRAVLEVEGLVLHLTTPVGDVAVRLSVPGAHNAHNATAAAAACVAAGLPLDAIASGLEAFRATRGRTQRSVVDGIVVIDDSYNANPDSMRAAIDLLATQVAPRLLVMGDMGEVGSDGPRFHAEIGAHARERGVDTVYALGDASRASIDAYGPAGRHFDAIEPLIAAVRAWVDARTGSGAIVVKGSRFMRMERVVASLVPAPASAPRSALMLLALAQWLGQDIRFFNVFTYITLRAVLATLTSLSIGLLCGPMVIRRLTALKIGQAVRSDGPQTHLIKSGTPTMGGALILIAIGVATLLWSDLSNRFMWVVLLVTFGNGWIGWVDDYRKVVRRDPKGMSAKEKYFWQSLIGLVAAMYLAFAVSANSNAEVAHLFFGWIRSGFDMDLPPKADFIVPFFKNVAYPLGAIGFIALNLHRDRRDQQRGQHHRRGSTGSRSCRRSWSAPRSACSRT